MWVNVLNLSWDFVIWRFKNVFRWGVSTVECVVCCTSWGIWALGYTNLLQVYLQACNSTVGLCLTVLQLHKRFSVIFVADFVSISQKYIKLGKNEQGKIFALVLPPKWGLFRLDQVSPKAKRTNFWVTSKYFYMVEDVWFRFSAQILSVCMCNKLFEDTKGKR